MPSAAKRKAKIAMIGEKSIMPKGGINFLKMSRYGSVTLEIICPNPDSFKLGIQLIRMLANKRKVYKLIAVNSKLTKNIIGSSCTSFIVDHHSNNPR